MDKEDRKFELMCGLLVAVFAAVLGISDLAAGKYGDDELLANNEKASVYLWYQSKGIKETLTEGQRDLLNALLEAEVVKADNVGDVKKFVQKLDADIKRYGMEKREILLGSAKVGEKKWAQDIDGKMGQVIGAEEWEEKAVKLSEVGDVFDFSSLFLQLCLVLGAVSLIIEERKLRFAFFYGMIGFGLLGSISSGWALILAMAI